MSYNKLFGNTIEVRCEYCAHAEKDENNVVFCTKKREIKNGKCFRFKYNPLMRIPKNAPALPKYSQDEFKL